jgi:hypothetical protein
MAFLLVRSQRPILRARIAVRQTAKPPGLQRAVTSGFGHPLRELLEFFDHLGLGCEFLLAAARGAKDSGEAFHV